MHEGILWFNNNPKMTLVEKVQQAIDHYTKKMERKPNLCLVNPTLMEPDKKQIDVSGVPVRPYRPVLPGHIWIGIEEMPSDETKR